MRRYQESVDEMDPEQTDLDEMDLEEVLDEMHPEEVYSFEITWHFSHKFEDGKKNIDLCFLFLLVGL